MLGRLEPRDERILLAITIFLGLLTLIFFICAIVSWISKSARKKKARAAELQSQVQQARAVPRVQAAAPAVLSPVAGPPENFKNWEIAIVVECVPPPELPSGDEFLNSRGWVYSKSVYRGRFQTSFGSWDGEVRCRDGDYLPYIKSPPRCIFTGHHTNCIMRRDDGWYLIHLHESLCDAVDTVIAIEAFISKKFQSLI